jgi:uncharacterized protein (DUF433 family)
MGAEHSLKDRIVQVPDILGGKPTVRGTRISVEMVLANLRDNPNFDDLLRGYPRLTMEDIQACLAYATEKVTRTRRPKSTGVSTQAKSAVV